MPDDLEQQLAAYGRTLAAETESRPDGGPITSGRIAEQATGRATAVPGSGARRWAILGAAACVAALVAGLALTIGPDDDRAPAAAPDATTGSGPTTTPSTPTSSTSTTSTTTTTVPPSALFAETVPLDPLGLEAAGWTLVQRDTEPFSGDGIEQDCPGAVAVAGFDGAAQVHDVLTPPDANGLDLDVTVVTTAYGRGTELAAGIMAIGDCIAAAGDVEVTTSSLADSGATWFRAGPDFALAAVVSDQVTVLLEIEGAEFDDALITDMIDRTRAFLTDSWPAAPTTTTPTLQPDEPAFMQTTTIAPPAGATVDGAALPEAPRQQATTEQSALLGEDPAAILLCDERGLATATFVTQIDGFGSPTEAFGWAYAGIATQRNEPSSQPLPVDGWVELVLSSSSSAFVLEVEGSAQVAIAVRLGTDGRWRAETSANCVSLGIV